jgi:hypothetical protein
MSEQVGPPLDEITVRKNLPDKLKEWIGKIRFRKERMQPHPQQAPEGGKEQKDTLQLLQQENENTSEAFDREFSKEIAALHEQSTPELEIIPSDRWAIHYQNGPDARQVAMESLLSGSVESSTEVPNLTPDALLYDQQEIADRGMTPVQQKIQDITTSVENYDYDQFARFLTQMQGTDITPELAESFYSRIMRPRIQRVMLDTYPTGERERALREIEQQTASLAKDIPLRTGMEKILDVAQTIMVGDDPRFTNYTQTFTPEDLLTAEDVSVYQQLVDAYGKYAEKDLPSYARLVQVIHDYYQQPHDEEPSFSQAPSDDTSEYTPPKENTPRLLFEIKPKEKDTRPLKGYYADGKHSYYNPATKKWDKRRQEQHYTTHIEGAGRQTIRGEVGADLTAIPIPDGHAIDMSSLDALGGAKIFRDQNGCFYIHMASPGIFAIDFLPEKPSFASSPVPEDREIIHRGILSAETEQFLATLKGTAVEKSRQINEYITSHHVYPEDLSVAGIMQDEMKARSTEDTYFQTLDNSEQLECLSSNTLAVAMERKAGIASRIVQGHKIDRIQQGRCVIDDTTGHAWREIWDDKGKRWIPMDATPAQLSQSEELDSDGGEPGESGEAQHGEGQQGEGEESQDFMPSDEATDRERQQGEQDFQQAQQAIDDANAQQEAMNQELDELLQDKKSFQSVDDIRREIEENPDLFDPMKEALQERLQAIEDEMKKDVRNKIEQMAKDGFINGQRRQQLLDQLNRATTDVMDSMKYRVNNESPEFNEYQQLKESVEEEVDKWYKFLVRILPKDDEIVRDEDILGSSGKMNRKALGNVRRVTTGKVMNPRTIRETSDPRFLAGFMLDISGSMEGNKIENAKKLGIFYNELFGRLSRDHTYIRTAQYAFSEDVHALKRFDEEWDPQREPSKLKLRFMQQMKAEGWTYMLPALQITREDIAEERRKFPHFASALTLVGDGGDTQGNTNTIRDFLSEGFVGTLPPSAVMMGGEAEKRILSEMFGEENTAVTPDFSQVIEVSMEQFQQKLVTYLRRMRVMS